MIATEFELCREPCATTAEVEILHARSGTAGGISSITPVSSVSKFLLLYPKASRSVESEAEVEDVIVLRELNKEAAKKEVLELIEREPGIGFYDISLKLRLELGF